MTDSKSNNKKKAQEIFDTVFIGIDLGTSRSAISTNAGSKTWVRSIIGWPKDFVAKKLLKKNVLIGEEVFENKLALDIYRPLERGIIKTGTDKSEESAMVLIKHLISNGLQSIKEYKKAFAVVGVPSMASEANKESIKTALKGLVNGLMIVSEPFTVAYNEDSLSNSIIIDIGAGTCDFCIMHGTIPTDDDQMTIYEAGDYIDDQLYESILDSYPEAQFTKHMVTSWKEKYSFVGKAPESVKVSMPVKGKPVTFDITENIRKSCESIIPSIVEVITDLIADFDPEFQEEARNNIILAGGCSLIRGLPEMLEDHLRDIGGATVKTVEDPLYCGAHGALLIAEDTSMEDWAKLSK